MKTVNYKELPIGALVSQTCVLHSYSVPLWICHTNSGKIQRYKNKNVTVTMH